MKNNILKYSAICAGVLMAFSAQAVEEGFEFHGYAKEGIAFTNDAKLNPGKYDWANSGSNQFSLPGNIYYTNTSGGRLGNEPNWLELHFDYGFAPKEGMNWAVKSNLTNNGGHESTVNVDEFYVLGDGIFAANPSATVWAGKRYYNRVNTFLTDAQAMSADGHGVGIDNVDLGFGKLNVGITMPYDSNYETTFGGAMYALSTSIKDIKVAEKVSLDLLASYGTYLGPNNDDDNFEKPDDAVQLAAKVFIGDWASNDELFIRYSMNTSGSITRGWEHKPETQLGGFFQGYKEAGPFRINYIWQFEVAEYDADARAVNGTSLEQNVWNSFVARVGYPWNAKTSTELEAGYEMADFEAVDSAMDGTNDGYKVTLAQNLHLGGGFWDRPVIRFYTTYASQDVESTSVFGWQGGDAPLGESHGLSFGAQFEAWW